MRKFIMMTFAVVTLAIAAPVAATAATPADGIATKAASNPGAGNVDISACYCRYNVRYYRYRYTYRTYGYRYTYRYRITYRW